MRIEPRVKPFVEVPNELIDEGLSIEAIAVYCVIERYGGLEIDTLIGKMIERGLQRYHTEYAVRELQQAGFIGDAPQSPTSPPAWDRRGKVPSKRSRPGYIYIVAGSGHYKIGRTRDLPSRMKNFGLHLPFPVRLVYSFPVENMIEAERSLHARFEHKRVNGEWFALNDQDIATIRTLMKG